MRIFLDIFVTTQFAIPVSIQGMERGSVSRSAFENQNATGDSHARDCEPSAGRRPALLSNPMRVMRDLIP